MESSTARWVTSVVVIAISLVYLDSPSRQTIQDLAQLKAAGRVTLPNVFVNLARKGFRVLS